MQNNTCSHAWNISCNEDVKKASPWAYYELIGDTGPNLTNVHVFFWTAMHDQLQAHRWCNVLSVFTPSIQKVLNMGEFGHTHPVLFLECHLVDTEKYWSAARSMHIAQPFCPWTMTNSYWPVLLIAVCFSCAKRVWELCLDDCFQWLSKEFFWFVHRNVLSVNVLYFCWFHVIFKFFRPFSKNV